MGLLKFLLFGVIIYYLFIFLSRFFVAFFLKRWMKKINQNINKKSTNEHYKEHQSGDTIIQYKDKEQKKKSNFEGEYVDFEDLNEDNT